MRFLSFIFATLFTVTCLAQAPVLTTAYSLDSIAMPVTEIAIVYDAGSFSSVVTYDEDRYLFTQTYADLDSLYGGELITLNVVGGVTVLVGRENIARVGRTSDGNTFYITKKPEQRRYITTDDFTTAGPGFEDVYFSTGTAIGIGTKDPQWTLDVVGTINASDSIMVGGTKLTVPDYVFKQTYRLPTIEQHAFMMHHNSHLPHVSSESEIHRNGYNVVKEALGVREELEIAHLYIEELHHRLKVLEQKIKNLEK